MQDSLKSNRVYNSPSSDPNRKILFIFIYVRHNKDTSKYNDHYQMGSFPERKSGTCRKIQIFISFSQLVKVKVNSLSTQWRQVWENRRTAPVVHNLGARWTRVVYFKLRPLYPLHVHWIRGVVGPRNGCGEKYRLSYRGPSRSNFCLHVYYTA